MFNIISHEGNANQNHKEILLCTPRRAIIKQSDNNKCWEVYREIETLIYCWCSHFENSLVISQIVFLSDLAYTVLFIWKWQSFYLCLRILLIPKAQLKFQFLKHLYTLRVYKFKIVVSLIDMKCCFHLLVFC